MALLSIVLPSYNEEQNIANTAQVLSDLLESEKIEYELIFINDGSKDGTKEIIKSYNDSRIIFYEGQNLGPAKSFFDLIGKAAKADYLFFEILLSVICGH